MVPTYSLSNSEVKIINKNLLCGMEIIHNVRFGVPTISWGRKIVVFTPKFP